MDIGCGDGTLLHLAMLKGTNNVTGLSGSEDEAAVLRTVPPEKIPASLREIARISVTGARIWIGEIPRFREPASVREFTNYPAMLWWLLRKRGVRTFLGMCRRILMGKQQEPVLRTAQSFWSDPDSFVRMASEASLTVERHFPHQTLDGEGKPFISPSRHDYVLRRE